MKLNKLGLAALMLALSGAGYGASIDHIQNYTPEYNANPAQQGAINAGTSAYYNPAGLVHIENGTYIQVGAQMAIGKEEMKYQGETYDSDLGDVVPNISIIRKSGDSAWYWTFGGLAGGGSLEYKDGVPGVIGLEKGINDAFEENRIPAKANITKQYAEGSNQYIQSTLGRAWLVTDKLSLSAAGRVVYGSRELKGDVSGEISRPGITGEKVIGKLDGSIDSERTAWGYGGIFGLNYQATEKLNIGMRYDTRVRMNFKADTDERVDWRYDGLLGSDSGSIHDVGFSSVYGQYRDGVKSRRDLPAILALGASYKVTDRWTTFIGGNYYFNKDAKLDEDYTEGEYDNGWEISVGSEYWINQKVAWLLGANYAVTGADEETYSDIEYAIDSFMLGTGIKYRQNETTEWVASVAHYWYEETEGTHLGEKYNTENVRYNKSITAVGVSLTKRF